MAPKNFAGRINDRRIGALDRLEAMLASGVRHNSGRTYPLDADDRRRIEKLASVLALRITSPDAARAVRTKKTKALGWSAARAAWRSGRLA